LPTKRSLTKAEILRRRSDITRVFGSNDVYRTQGLHLRIINNDLEWSRVLFATPRVMRGAVVRNRSRRFVREAYRQVKGRITGHYDMAFVIYPGDYGFFDRLRQMETLLNQADCIRPVEG
jgi:ribonuclease P protein component